MVPQGIFSRFFFFFLNEIFLVYRGITFVILYAFLSILLLLLFMFHKILQLDSTNIESLACLAANHFYEDHPEVALRLYRRIMHMGVMNTELWTNMALCCFYASQVIVVSTLLALF